MERTVTHPSAHSSHAISFSSRRRVSNERGPAPPANIRGARDSSSAMLFFSTCSYEFILYYYYRRIITAGPSKTGSRRVIALGGGLLFAGLDVWRPFVESQNWGYCLSYVFMKLTVNGLARACVVLMDVNELYRLVRSSQGCLYVYSLLD